MAESGKSSSRWVRWVIWALAADEVLGFLAFASYTAFFLPNPTGFALQSVAWAFVIVLTLF